MRRAIWWLLPGALLCATVTACGQQPEGDAHSGDDADGLAGRSWVVSDVADPRHQVVPGSTIRLEFTGDSVAVQAGCNNLGGAYEVEGGRLVVDQLGGTEMGCDQPLMVQDTWITAFLSADPAVDLAGPELVLSTEGTTMRLSEQTRTAAPLEGTQWRLDSLVDGTGPAGSVSSVPPAAADARLVLDDGTLTLTYGCTTMTAPVEVAGSQLRADDLAVTSRDCAPRLPELERRIDLVLSPPTAYVVTGDNLMLSSADGVTGLGFVAADHG